MKNAFKDIAKEAVLFGLSATLLALAEPLLASAVGPMVGVKFAEATVEAVKTASPAIWLGAFFAAFGAIFATVRSTANYLFGDKKGGVSEKSGKNSPHVAVIMHQPEISLEQEIECCQHRDAVKTHRANTAETMIRQ